MKLSKVCSIIMAIAILFTLGACSNPVVVPQDKPTFYDDVMPASIIGTDNKNIDKVSTAATFTINQNASTVPASILKTHSLFGSKMVVQQMMVNRIFGTTTQTKVAIKFNDETYYGTVVNCKWEVYLPPMNATNDSNTITIYTESYKLVLTDVLIGEVYLLSGQSNMASFLGQYDALSNELSKVNDDKLRFFNVPTCPAGIGEELTEIEDFPSVVGWQNANVETARFFSAAGYFYGKQLREKLQVPVGLVSSSVGGSQIAYWLPQENVDKIDNLCSNKVITYDSNGYKTMIHPLLGFTFRGVLWYQGETDGMGEHGGYEEALTTLINVYRERFKLDLLFVLIELPRYQSATGFANIRRIQKSVASKMEKVCMSISIDLGDWTEIHPNDKPEIAARAADEVLYSFYGIDSKRHPRLVNTERISDTKVKLTFVNVGDGLVIQNEGVGFELTTKNGLFIKSGYTVTLSDNKKSVFVESTRKSPLVRVDYGINPLLTQDQQAVASKHLSIYNSYGYAADQFIATFES